ncbi:hypothetical protein FDK15_01200, partial [Geobacillus thermoleovorans]
LLHFPCMSRIHSTMDTKNPPDFRWEGAKCELERGCLVVVETSSSLLETPMCFWLSICGR